MIQPQRLPGFIFAAFFAASALPSYLWGQTESPWQALPQGIQYDGQIPTPEQHFGGDFKIGHRHLNHQQLLDYLHAVDNASTRVSVETYGQSYGGRPLLVAIITSPQNQNQLNELATARVRWTNPREPRPPTPPLPVIYLAYSVHGNEASGANAAPLILYHLAAAQGTEMDQFLERTIVIIDVCLNPDGYDRFVSWVNANRGQRANPDPVHREHHEGWPNGRTNYYWFDLNRDWLPAQHPETQGRLTVLRKWMPNLVLDFHEMGTQHTFFFQPGVPSRKHPLIPASNIELTNRIGALHAASFDQTGTQYFTEEMFDDFYPGKGSTYPDFHGAVGILFEQASSRGVIQDSPNGLLSFEFTVRNQVLTSISSLQAIDQLREPLLENQRKFYEDAMTLDDAKPRSYVFSAPQDPARIAAFAQLLERHGILAHPLRKDLAANGINFRQADSLAVPAIQPERRFLEAMIERRTTFEDSVFYDVSAWCVPLAFDLVQAELSVNAAEIADESQKFSVKSERIELQGDDVVAVIDGHGYYLPRTLYQLLEQDVRVKVATQDFTIQHGNTGETTSFKPGALVIPLGIQAEKRTSIQEILNRGMQQDSIAVVTSKSGLTADGPDLGSSKFVTLERPQILLLVGRGVKASEAGEVWHLLDQRFEVPLTLCDVDDFDEADLAKYNVIVMVSGRYTALTSSIRDELKAWIENGGTFIAIGTACEFVTDQKWSDIQLIPKPVDTDERRPFAEMQDDTARKRIAGAILQTNVDLTHPLAFGLRPNLPVMRDNVAYIQPSKDPYSTPLVYNSSPLLSGHVSEKQLATLAGSAAVVARPMGEGRVIVMADNPNYRAFWYGTNRLFWNAIFFGPLVRAPAATDTDEHE